MKFIYDARLLIEICFFPAVKCNDNLIVIEVLAALGINFDCASKVRSNIKYIFHYGKRCTLIDTFYKKNIIYIFTLQNEINKVLSFGVESSRIIFANPAKPASHIRHAAAVGVDTMTVDNESELHKIKKLFPTAKVIVCYVISVHTAYLSRIQ